MNDPLTIEHAYEAFEGRRGRYEFIRRDFAPLVDEAASILDVGCDDNYLKHAYGNKVYGVDQGGTPDRQVDLEKEALRFILDGAYELVICTEVLEHLDNLHEMMDELIRVSSRYVLVSLPNASSTQRLAKVIRTGRNWKFYGLPYEKPADRHKWFFSYREIIDFYRHVAQTRGLALRRLILHYGVIFPGERRPLHRLKQRLEASLIALLGWENQCQDVLVLFEKPHEDKHRHSHI